MPVENFVALGMSWTEVWLTVITAAGIYATMLLLSRLYGPRQFSTFMTYDLAFIFAMGSLVGRVILVRTSLMGAVVGLVTMFSLHTAVGRLHHRVPMFHRLIQNRPVLLVAQGAIVEENIGRARTSHSEVYQQLRARGIAAVGEVGAAILERDGTLSVIRRDARFDAEVFREVIGREWLQGDGDHRGR